MAIIKPFRALRPRDKYASTVASVPYDVVNRVEAKELAKDNPLNLLHVTRAEIDLDDKINPYSSEVYQKAKNNLDEIISGGYLIAEEEPKFYLYKLTMDGRSQTGIAATFSVDDYDNDVILKHEKTRKEKEDDRTNHIITTGAQTGPVFLTYRNVSLIDSVVEDTIKTSLPIYNFTSSDGIEHTIWILPKDKNQIIIDEIAKVKNLYIADGHHRAASASRARKLKQTINPAHKGSEEYNYFIAVLFPANQLKILPYNRIVLDLNEKSKDEFLNEISDKFFIDKASMKEPLERYKFGMFLDGEWYLIKAKDSIIASGSLSKSIAENLDVSILQDFLLNPVLGIDDPRTNKRIDFVGGIRGTKELEQLVNNGKAAIAFSLFPVSVSDLMRISDAGEIMPPKSTWFEPKLRDGLLVHLI